jgi:hypothetical protein
VGGQHHAPAALPPGNDPVPIVQEAWWISGPVWTDSENLATTGIPRTIQPVASRYTDYANANPGAFSGTRDYRRLYSYLHGMVLTQAQGQLLL